MTVNRLVCRGVTASTRERYFRVRKYALPHSRFVLEIRVHSRSVSCLLSELVHNVTVAPPLNVRLIGESRERWMDRRTDNVLGCAQGSGARHYNGNPAA